MPARVEKLRRAMAAKDLDAFLVSSLSNCRYLSGFTGSTVYLLVTAHKAVIAVDFRYVEHARKECPDFQLQAVKGGIADWFPGLATELGANRWAIESMSLSLATYQALTDRIARDRAPLQLLPTVDIVESLRAVKEPGEIENITLAAALVDRGFAFARSEMRAGMTEKALAWRLERFLRDNASDALPFEIIVASGPNAALPHTHPTEREIGPGEPVVIDVGTRTAGYCSDFTRTICVGEPDVTLCKIHSIVLGAQLTALATIQAGMTGEQADQLARVVINEAGYGDNFGHGLGHGIGIEVHEPPRLGARSPDVLVKDMVFSVEPGIYLAGWGGVRIEDTVLMEERYVRALTRSDKSLKA